MTFTRAAQTYFQVTVHSMFVQFVRKHKYVKIALNIAGSTGVVQI